MARKKPADLYRSMHSGLTAKAIRVPAMKPPRTLIDLRRVTAIEGDQLQGPGRVQGSGKILYRHEFEGNSGPMIARDAGKSRNNMVLVGGSYRINDEGMIEDNMSRKKHQWMKRYVKNPESTLAFLAEVGLALAVVGIITELVVGMLPQSWSARTKMLGTDALLVIGGAMVYKKSPVWGIAMTGFGIGDATQAAYVGLGIDAKVRAIFHRAGVTYATVTVGDGTAVQPGTSTVIPTGAYYVTYSDGRTPATLPAGTNPPPTAGNAIGASGAIMYRLPAPQRNNAQQFSRPGQRVGNW